MAYNAHCTLRWRFKSVPPTHVHAAVHDLRLERLEFCRDSLPLHRLGLLPLPLLLERAAVVPNLREAEVSR